MITAPPPPPVVDEPAAYAVSYGLVAGVAAPGTRRVIVRVGGRTLADSPLRGRRFQLRVALPLAETAVEVVTVGRSGRRSRAVVGHVLGLPRPAAPQVRRPVADPVLGRRIRSLAASFGATSSIYVLNLTTGAGAAWNARATLPAASTLKLPIAVAALARSDGIPAYGSPLDRLLRQMLTYSDNAAANATEQYYGGSVHGGSALVNALMQSVGLVDTEMYGGYELEAVGSGSRGMASSIPLRVESQPSWGPGASEPHRTCSPAARRQSLCGASAADGSRLDGEARAPAMQAPSPCGHALGVRDRKMVSGPGRRWFGIPGSRY